MSLYRGLLRPLLFRLDPEAAHNLAMRAVEAGMVHAHSVSAAGLEREFFGVKFPIRSALPRGLTRTASP